jgi:hypothetical protein
MKRKQQKREVTRVTVTLRLVVEDSEIEKMIYNAIEEKDIKALTDLVEYCNSIDTRIRSTVLEKIK